MPKNKDNREKLLHAGLLLLAQKTPDKISMDDVAFEAGVTKPMIYYYFGSKVGYYNHLVTHIEQTLQVILTDCIQPDSPFRDILIRIIRGRIELMTRHPEISNAVRIMATSKTIGGAESRPKIITMFNRLQPAFDNAKIRGEIREDADLHLIMAMTNSLLDGALRIHGKEFLTATDPTSFAEMLVRLVFDGVGTEKRHTK
ncbi:MAG: TetR/AcrR family transcriptional regulator [Candidatus Sabulitectum sp.]|nr:TetR/AcrR family transcriptional regulator [Candidatus Sabulitectum sp.]